MMKEQILQREIDILQEALMLLCEGCASMVPNAEQEGLSAKKFRNDSVMDAINHYRNDNCSKISLSLTDEFPILQTSDEILEEIIGSRRICQDCGSKLKYCLNTLAYLDNDDTKDDINMIEAWVCPDCNYWEEA